METLKIAKDWAQNTYFEQADRNEIQRLIDENNQKEIEDRFYRDLEFGTGGLRSIVGMGRNRMNKYTVRKATQALATTLLKEKSNPKVAISYDSRNMSEEFAKETASVMAANGIIAYIFDRLNPVPLLSFSTRYHKADAGIMITASHNPPAYNGYKVYWNDGCQVTPPHDQNIIDCYNKLENWNEIKFMDFEAALKEERIRWVGDEVYNAYHKMLNENVINPQMCQNDGDKIKIVYTAIHGTGNIPCLRALQEMGIKNVWDVPEQREPDTKFSTVKSPNPENPAALKLAVDLLKEKQADIAFGTDPDADRLGVAVSHKDGQIYYLSGNQIGVLLLDYILSSLKKQNRLPKNPLVLKSIVTSELQTEVANHYGAQMENVLTGFKWIGQRMTQIQENNLDLQYVFGSEESFGYLGHREVRDKDAVNATALVAEMALAHKLQGNTLIDALHQIFERHGYFQEGLLSLDFEGAEGANKITRIMESFRNGLSQNKAPTICGEKITRVEDYKTQMQNNVAAGTSEAINLPASNVIAYVLESGTKLFLRPSGTEPKIKFYIMIKEQNGSLIERKEKATKRLEEFKSYFSDESNKA